MSVIRRDIKAEELLGTDFCEVEKKLDELYPHGSPEFIPMCLEEMELHSAKNADYAKGGDPLGNFKRVANILSNYPNLDPSDPMVVCIIYALKQFDAALWMKSQGYDGEVENIDTRLRDVHVYAKIARILELESK
ncbi:MAG: hypothetical protein M0R49_01070 [Limnochordia bacterium]|jgi:hypothetical protein|nr:hypothetical protein [Limnochordia bacterium]